MHPTISIEGEHFALTIYEGKREHTVRIPLDRHDQLISVLMARQRGAIKIAERGSPTQWNIDREAATIEEFVAAKQRATLADLEELGIL